MRSSCCAFIGLMVLVGTTSASTSNLTSDSSLISTSTQHYQAHWQPCSFTDSTLRARVEPIYLNKTDVDKFECTKVKAPLCHDGICKSNNTIELFIKRKVANAKNADGKKPLAIWFLNGGPGSPLADLEPLMTGVYYAINRTASVFSLDHRGVALSSPLDCGVPQVTMTPNQFAICINKLLPEMDNNPVAYSTTSAAMDVQRLIANLNQDQDVFVYGDSYGTYWAEHLMHLAPPYVKGYILDGVVAEAGDPKFTITNWNKNRRPTAVRLFDYCASSSDCPLKLNSDGSTDQSGNVKLNLHDQVLQHFDALDRAPNQCVKNDQMKPSAFLRDQVISRLEQIDHLEVIPYVLSLFFTCDARAQQLIPKIMNALIPPTPQPRDEDIATAPTLMLTYLIVFSELWTVPAPSLHELDQMYLDGVIVSNRTSDALLGCVFLNDHDKPAYCNSMSLSLSSKTKSFIYERDAFYNKTATIPKGASVLFLNGKLDFNTPVESQELEFNAMQGGAKLSVQFDYGRHVVAMTDDTQPCAVNVIASYMIARGDSSKTDTSCVSTTPRWDWTAKQFVELVETRAGPIQCL